MTELEDAENRKMIIPLAYIIPTYILYVFILFTIFVSRAKHKFATSFYTIFSFSAINYVLHSVTYYFGMRVTNTPAFLGFVKTWVNHTFITALPFILMYYSAFALHFYSLTISFNRFTVFLLKMKYKFFWERYIYFFIGFCLLGPLIFVWHMPFTDTSLKLANSSNPEGMRYFSQLEAKKFPWWDNSQNLALVIFITAILSFFMNMYVISQIIKQRWWTKASQSSHKVSSQDIKMFGYCMLIFSTEIISVVQQLILKSTNDQAVFASLFAIQYYIADISTLTPAWFILLTNRNLRHQLAMLVCAMKPEDIAISSTNNSGQSHSNMTRSRTRSSARRVSHK